MTKPDIKNPEYIVLDKRQSVAASVVSDGATFSFLALCIWISQGSTWWTFFTATLFLLYLFARLSVQVKERHHRFKGIAELRAWVDAEEAREART